MKKIFLLFCLTAFAANSVAQTSKDGKPVKSSANGESAAAKGVVIKPDATPLELVRAAVAAHGGDKFKTMKSLTQIGSVDVAMPNSAQMMTASFKLVIAGEKFRFDLNSQFANFQQIYDGENLSASMGGADIPPLSKLGIKLLVKAEDKGYTVSALPDKKKRRGFRITTPEGYKTDFYLDPATAQVMSYEAKFIAREREVSTFVEHDKFRVVEGVVAPEKYSQSFVIGGNTFYANFKAKEILVNTTVADDVFALPQ